MGPGRPGKGETKERIKSDQWRGIEIMRPSIASIDAAIMEEEEEGEGTVRPGRE